MSSPTSENRSAFLAFLEDDTKDILSKELALRQFLTPKQRDDLSSVVASKVVNSVFQAWGGQQVYINKDHKRRAALILAEFTGNNHADLARRFGLCVQSVYRIIKADRAARRLSQGNILDYVKE